LSEDGLIDVRIGRRKSNIKQRPMYVTRLLFCSRSSLAALPAVRAVTHMRSTNDKKWTSDLNA
jgi:hypothetical protein